MIGATIISNNLTSVHESIVTFATDFTPAIFAEKQRRATIELAKVSLDNEGKTMRPLTKQYLRLKKKLGLPGKPNMSLYGDLLHPKNFKYNEATAELRFGSDDEDLQARKAKGNLKHRHFFGVNAMALIQAGQEAQKEFNNI